MATFDARLGQFIVDRQPTADHSVEILCQDHVGTYSPPFHCHWTGDGWINCRTDELVLATVLGWRERVPAIGIAARRQAGRLRPSAHH